MVSQAYMRSIQIQFPHYPISRMLDSFQHHIQRTLKLSPILYKNKNKKHVTLSLSLQKRLKQLV